MDSILNKAKELGMAIKEHDITKRMHLAEIAVSGDTGLQDRLSDFNKLREEMFSMMQSGEEDQSKIEPMNEKIKAIYDEIMATDIMKNFNAAKEAYDKLIGDVNNVISFQITGEEPGGCSPSACSSCGGGCH